MTNALQRLPPPLAAQLQAVLQKAAQDPARRSEILGSTALGLAARSRHPAHMKDAPVLRALAERIAEAAMAGGQDLGPATLDDFQETLEEHDAAHERFADDLDVRAHADEIHDLKMAQHGARVSIAPLSWGKGATLGRTGRFKYNPSPEEIAQNISQSGTLSYWQGEPHEAQAITVDLAPTADSLPRPLATLPSGPAPGPDTSSRPRGIVSYGSDGAIARVPFDAGFGARFIVPGNYVAVQLDMEPPLSGAGSGTLSYTSSIGAFASPSVAPVFYTVYIDQLENGATTDGGSGRLPPIQRPMHATAILPVLTDAMAGNALLRFYGQGAVTVLMQFNYPVGQLLNPIPLPAEVQYITLTNVTGDTANFRIPFQLSL